MRFLIVAAATTSIAFLAGYQFAQAETGAPSSSSTQQGEAAQKPAGDAPAATGATAEAETQSAVFAGGCFWCTEFAFEQIAGVLAVESGYCGGTKETANYDQVRMGTTRHAEAIRVIYDPKKISYDTLLNIFFDAHDPTQLNRQGPGDVGPQYRSAIFFANEDQKKQAEAKIEELNAKKVHKKPIVTTLEPLGEFYVAEEYHQDFVQRNPFLPYIQKQALPKAYKVRVKHPDLIRKGE